MFRKIALAGCAAALLFGAIPAQAGLTTNGIGLNGQVFNGINLNGFSFNGVNLNGNSLNGINFNGLQLNGRSVQGTSQDGTRPDSISRLQVVGVELPPEAN